MRIEERFQSGVSLSNLSTFGIGGRARLYFKAREISDIQEALQWAIQHKTPYFILGKGSNCLFDDRGFNGLVIHNRIDFCEFSNFSVFAGAGYSFSLLGVQTARKGWGGLEFASGIPGTVGGAIYMNAGANGRETCQALHEVIFIDENGEQRNLSKEDLPFGYRYSPFQNMRGCIAAVRFSLKEDSSARKSQLSIIDYRLKTQPLKDKSAGCVFRNPANESAGLLIDRCGLKNSSVGGAKISEVHANFIVNASGATSADVLALIEIVQLRVYDQTGIRLEMEVRTVPYT